MGAIGSGGITPLEDNVNVRARLSSEAKSGKIFIGESSYKSLAIEVQAFVIAMSGPVALAK